MHAAKAQLFMNNFEFIVSLAINSCICKQNTNWKSLTFNMQSEFTALKKIEIITNILFGPFWV